MKRPNGFTLIELVGALVVISILAGIILVTTGGSREHALQARINADVEAINAAKGFWVLDHNGAAFPTEEADRFAAIQKYLAINRPIGSLQDFEPTGVTYAINGIGESATHSP